MAWADFRQVSGRGVLLALAVMALVMRVAIPQGFMLASPDAASGPQLVICTGHGPLKAGPVAPADKSRPDTPCVFAGHGAGAAPPTAPQAEALAFLSPAEPQRPIPGDALPGRGLAAPPPPSLAPPLTV